MLQRSIVLTFVCVAFCRPVAAGADEPKTADDVIAHYIDAIGGRAKLDSVKSLRMTGKAIGMGGMEVPLVVEFKRPKKVRVEFTVQGMAGVQAFDGKTGWFIMPFMGKTDPEKMPPDMVEVIEEQGDFEGSLVDYKKKGHQVELVGKDDFEGSEVYKLKVTKKSGKIEYYFLDAEYYILLQVKGKRKFQGTEVEMTTKFGDYKEVDGLLLPHSIQQGGMAGDTTFEKIELNVNIPDDRFTMPEVKKEEPVSTDKTKPGPDDANSTEKDEG